MFPSGSELVFLIILLDLHEKREEAQSSECVYKLGRAAGRMINWVVKKSQENPLIQPTSTLRSPWRYKLKLSSFAHAGILTYNLETKLVFIFIENI